MKYNQEINRLFRQEFPEVLPNMIWQNDEGDYELFGKYKIVPVRPGYKVFCSATEVGTFGSSRTALSWCIADKFQRYTLAREILETDAKLLHLTNDIAIRAALADRSKRQEFRDEVGTKLETKIIHKKKLENQLTKCVNWAKYCQQRGFNNETARPGRITTNKASR